MANILSNAANSAADNAALQAAASTIPTLSNSEAMGEAFLDRCREWGEKAGAGDTSKVGMILDIARTAWDVNSPVGPGLGPTGYASRAYDAWREAKIRKNPRSKAKNDDRSRANRVSEINKYLKVGALPLIRDTDMGGYSVLKRAEKFIVEREDIKGEVEDLLSKVATAQLKSPAVPLPDDRILDVLTGADKPGKVELTPEEAEAKLWGNVIVQIDSIRGKFPNGAVNDTVVPARDDSNILQARDAISNRIHALGGTPAQRATQAKADAKALAAAAKKANGKRKRK